MADNVAITAGTGTSIASDDIGGVQYQRTKLSLGADGSAVDAVAGAGAVGTGVQRVTLASDDPAVTDLAAIEVLLTGMDADTDAIKTNTAALALESGGNLAAAVSALTAIAGYLDTEVAALVTAAQLIDNVVSGNEAQCDVITQPARAATTDTITAKLATDTLQDGTTALTPKFAAIAASSSGDNTLVAAVSGKKIRVLSYTLVAAGAVTCRFEDGAGGTAKSGVMSFGANGGVSVPFSPLGHFETTANTLLNLELGGAVSVAGHVCYVEV